ncbi:MAG: nickel-binding protein [Solirubrobacteraceae bacterium]|jgi:muconolactone delta-isomerase
MREYLLELYLSRTDEPAAVASGERARAAAQELTRRGTPVSFLRSFFVPEEETFFVLFEADSADAIRDVARLASLPCERVSLALTRP